MCISICTTQRTTSLFLLVVNEYLNEPGISLFNSPPKFPDLNPIDDAWDLLGRRLIARPVLPTNLSELEGATIEEWEEIPQELIQNLIGSMLNRFCEVMSARGVVTRFD